MPPRITERVKKQGIKMGMRAMSRIMAQPDRAEKVMRAVQGVQTARERVDETTARVLNAGQIPSREDIRELTRQAGKLRRQTKRIMAALDDLEKKLEAPRSAD